MKKIIKRLLSKFPVIDGIFRRFIWSHIHFPEYEMKFLDSLPTASLDVAIDVGAALGSYSWILNRKFKSVYAFEPGDTHYRYMSSLIFLTKITLNKFAVGRDDRQVEFYTPGDDTEAFHSATVSADNPVIATQNVNVNKIDQISLDSFLERNIDSSRSVDLLKIDIEGYELEAFLGAKNLISIHKPLIICEIEARHNVKYPEVFSFLREMDYKCFFWRDNSFVKFDDNEIENLQQDKDLEIRLSPDFNPSENHYINNFIFQHPESKIKVSQ